MANILLDSAWPGVAVWSALFISDYALTVSCARLYRAGVSDKIVFEGSLEITPLYQSDIDSLRLVSPRFLLMLVLTAALMFIMFNVASQSLPEMYYFVLGAFISLQLSVHARHFRNLFLFRAIIKGGVRGRIEYSRPVLLRGSACELLTFAGIFIILFVFTQSWFMVGGAFACSVTALKHWRLAHKHVSSAQSLKSA